MSFNCSQKKKKQNLKNLNTFAVTLTNSSHARIILTAVLLKRFIRSFNEFLSPTESSFKAFNNSLACLATKITY